MFEEFKKYTYLICYYNASVRIIDLDSHTTYVVCVNFIPKWRGLQLKVDSERQIFDKLFMAILIWRKSAERKLPKKCLF